MGEQLGVRAGETLCHITYLEMSRSLVSMPISQAHTPTDTQKHKHMPPPSRHDYFSFHLTCVNVKSQTPHIWKQNRVRSIVSVYQHI